MCALNLRLLSLDTVRKFVYEKCQSRSLPAVYWPILLFETKCVFFIKHSPDEQPRSTRINFASRNPLAGENVQYFVLLNICLVYLMPLFLAQPTLQLIVWLQNTMEQKAHGSSKMRQQKCLSEWLASQSRYKLGTSQIRTRRFID